MACALLVNLFFACAPEPIKKFLTAGQVRPRQLFVRPQEVMR